MTMGNFCSCGRLVVFQPMVIPCFTDLLIKTCCHVMSPCRTSPQLPELCKRTSPILLMPSLATSEPVTMPAGQHAWCPSCLLCLTKTATVSCRAHFLGGSRKPVSRNMAATAGHEFACRIIGTGCRSATGQPVGAAAHGAGHQKPFKHAKARRQRSVRARGKGKGR